MNYVINKMNELNAKEISSWRYEEPYSIYNMDGSEENINELMNGFYYSAHKNNELVGYFCFGKSAQVPANNEVNVYQDKTYLDIGLGLKPELCGNGQGYNFLKCGLNFAVNNFSKNKFRLTVAKFNQRAIKAYKKLGFKQDVVFIKKGTKENIEFIIMRLERKI